MATNATQQTRQKPVHRQPVSKKTSTVRVGSVLLDVWRSSMRKRGAFLSGLARGG